MKTIRFDEYGEPERVLSLREEPDPDPAPGQVLVRMLARPINPADLSFIRGLYGFRPRLPATPGFEGAGRIERLGEGVTSLQVGQQVVPLVAGSWQEYVVVDASALLPLPDELSLQQAATLRINPASAWLMLEEELRAQPGDWIVQNAGNSAVARHVVQIARMRGYRTICVVRRADVVAELLEEGADHVLMEDDEDLPGRVIEITGGSGVNHALDAVGGESGSNLVKSLGRGGTMLVYGSLTRRPLTIESGPMLFRGTTVRGWWLSDWMRRSTPERRAELFGSLADLVVQGVLRTPIEAEFPLGEVVAAVREAEGSRRNGKILLVG